MTRTVLSPTAQRLERIHRKIAKVEEEIGEGQRPDFRMVLTIDARCFPRRFAGRTLRWPSGRRPLASET